MRRKLACSAVGSLLSLGAIAAPVIYNNDVVSGRAAFDSTITGVGGTVQTLALSGLTSNASSWTLPGLTIRATDNTDRFVYGDYSGYRAGGRSYAVGGATIAIAPAVPASGSGLTFTFATPVNAFGLEIADWATCCTSVLHPDTGAPVGSNLFISFDGGATRIVANAINADSNPGNKDYDGDGTTDYAFTNFVAAIDDSRTFSTVTFYGDGLGEALYAGGTLRWAAVSAGSVSSPASAPAPSAIDEPAVVGLAGMAIGGALLNRRRRLRWQHGRPETR